MLQFRNLNFVQNKNTFKFQKLLTEKVILVIDYYFTPFLKDHFKQDTRVAKVNKNIDQFIFFDKCLFTIFFRNVLCNVIETLHHNSDNGFMVYF